MADAPSPAPSAAEPSDGFWIAFGLAALAYLLPFWIVKYPPMIDLPQRAAQVWLLGHLNEPEVAARYELHGWSPYVLSYYLGWLFARVLSVPDAMRLLISLIVVSMPLSLLALLRANRGDRWWALLGFPLSFGPCFMWGVTPYLAAVPLGLFCIAICRDVRDDLTRGRRLQLIVCVAALYFTHALAWAIAAALALATLAVAGWLRRQAFLLAAILLSPGPLAVGWYLFAKSSYTMVNKGGAWELGLDRLLQFPVFQIDPGTSSLGLVYGGVLLALLAAIFWAGRSAVRSWRYAVPAGLALLAYLLCPTQYFHTFFLEQRVAVFVVPLALAAAASAPQPNAKRILQRAVALTVLAGSAFLWVRLPAFDRETQPFQKIAERMKPGKKLFFLMVDPESRALGRPYFLHFPAWYQAEKGGTAEFSFASLFAEPVRYRDGMGPPLPQGFEWPPLDMSHEELLRYDYYLIRAHEDVLPRLMSRGPNDLTLLAQEEHWRLYGHQGAEP
ncbi:MAG: hypothetical protein KIS92_00510 [Planctomycetota bacterium]|nr:hypothetical protein [Planctomycetota bacterium]